MAIKFAGESLLLPDSEHQLEQWLDFALPIEDLNLFSWHSASQVDNRSQSRSSLKSRVGLSTPNWPAPPDVKINSLYVPTGATRWAVGLFLVDSLTLTKIRDNIDDNGYGTLTLETVVGGDVDMTMHMLTPRRITPPSATAQNDELWLLPLVDERYWWQFKNAGNYSLTWADSGREELLEAAKGDITVDTPPSAFVYFQPDPIELTRPYENSAILLDAIAASTGSRLVVSDGEVIIEGWANSIVKLKANLEVDDDGKRTANAVWDLLAGGWGAHDHMPVYVEVVFQKYVNGNGVSDNDRWVKQIAANLYGTVPILQGAKKTIFTTAAANFTSGGGTPSNAVNVDDLAANIASDYVRWIDGKFSHYDVTFHGIRPWTSNGFDDYVLYRFGCQNRSPQDEAVADISFFAHENAGEYTCYTRAVSLPINYGPSEQLQQVMDAREPFGRYQGILLEDLASADSTVDCDHVQPIDGSPSCLVDPEDDEEVVELYNVTGFAGDLGNLVIFRWNRYTKQLEVEDTNCPAED